MCCLQVRLLVWPLWLETDTLDPALSDVALLQEDKEAMIAGVRAVNTSRADLGIVVDTDVDRSAVVAGNGTPINSNRYIALMSYIALRSAPIARSAQITYSHLSRAWHRVHRNRLFTCTQRCLHPLQIAVQLRHFKAAQQNMSDAYLA